MNPYVSVTERRFSLNANIPATNNKMQLGIPRRLAIASITMPHAINKVQIIFLFFILKATYKLAKLTKINRKTCKISPPKKRPRMGIPIRLLT